LCYPVSLVSYSGSIGKQAPNEIEVRKGTANNIRTLQQKNYTKEGNSIKLVP